MTIVPLPSDEVRGGEADFFQADGRTLFSVLLPGGPPAQVLLRVGDKTLAAGENPLKMRMDDCDKLDPNRME